jgi:hypothetical protein
MLSFFNVVNKNNPSIIGASSDCRSSSDDECLQDSYNIKTINELFEKLEQQYKYFEDQLDRGHLIEENLLLERKRELEEILKFVTIRTSAAQDTLQGLTLSNNYLKTSKEIRKRPRHQDDMASVSSKRSISTTSTSSILLSDRCYCTKGCLTNRCPCKREGGHCSSNCQCSQCANQ